MTTRHQHTSLSSLCVIAGILLLIQTFSTYATTLFTSVASGGDKSVVAIIQNDTGFEFITYEYGGDPPYWPYPGNPPFPLIPIQERKDLTVDSPVPTILVFSESSAFTSDMNALYVGGNTIAQIDYQRNGGWIYSYWLKWANISNYPNVFTADDGWIYIKEESDTVFSIYNYTTSTWTVRDLSTELFWAYSGK